MHSIQHTWDHHRRGILSLCAIGSHCTYVGDGGGMLYCYNTQSQDLMFGLGGCEGGGIPVVHYTEGKLLSGGEDGKVLVFSFH